MYMKVHYSSARVCRIVLYPSPCLGYDDNADHRDAHGCNSRCLGAHSKPVLSICTVTCFACGTSAGVL